ncbi:HD-GYP domain-containing protein [Alteromonas sp. a30]|uniref:HD-GYP domain-containing protein n=1 Tax=Alteromonas sp. a30 TaxID=2730917 RepID=UPI002280384E|nr:HD-GYP domain-containing protein [Alteromonas sp. a30]MCY7296007.1 HD-GYP domain-containing protein [Alteromonas sp. a30]
MADNHFLQIRIDDLAPGMFVNNVLEQEGQLRIKSKGIVKSWDIIEKLKGKGISLLEIDPSRSSSKAIQAWQDTTSDTPTDSDQDDLHPPAKKLTEGEALNEAQKLYDQAKLAHKRFLKKIKTGEIGNLDALKESGAKIIDSLFANPYALQCLTLIKDDQEYLLQHCLNTAILMGVFAKHMGFDKQLIEELCLAGLLMDTGMSTVPQEIYDKPRKLTDNEWDIIHSHVDLGLEMIQQMDNLPETVKSIIVNHHERLDGSGYPANKSGDKITIYSRMAAIVDTYDALTSDRPWRKAHSPTAALKKLLADDSGKLDQSLVHQFIKCIGVHPVGSLVRLKSERLGIIVQSNPEDPLKPVVMTFYSVTAGHHTEMKRLDLAKSQDEIMSGVRPEEFKINLNRFFREVFLSKIV